MARKACHSLAVLERLFPTLVALRGPVRVDMCDVFLMWQMMTCSTSVSTTDNSLLEREAGVELKNGISSPSILAYSCNTAVRRVLLISPNYNILSIRVGVRRLYIEVGERIPVEKSLNGTGCA